MNQKTETQPEEMLTAKEVAKFLRMHEVTLAKHRQEGRGIPFTRVGRKVLYRRSEVMAALANNTRGTLSAA